MIVEKTLQWFVQRFMKKLFPVWLFQNNFSQRRALIVLIITFEAHAECCKLKQLRDCVWSRLVSKEQPRKGRRAVKSLPTQVDRCVVHFIKVIYGFNSSTLASLATQTNYMKLIA